MRSINLQMDGNQLCATWDNFDCLATSSTGFGDTIGGAVNALIADSSAIEINAIMSSIENAPQNTKVLADTATNKPSAEICPLCEGRGTIGTYMFRDPPEAKVCYRCKGAGKLSHVG